jgi:hypothetical protein
VILPAFPPNLNTLGREKPTELTLQIQGWTEVPGLDGTPILQELSDHEPDVEAAQSLQRTTLYLHMLEMTVQMITTPVIDNYRVQWGQAFHEAHVKTVSGKDPLFSDTVRYYLLRGY